MILVLFFVLFAPIAGYEFLKLYKESKKDNKPHSLNNDDFYPLQQLIPWYDLNDGNGYRIEDGQGVFVVSSNAKLQLISYCKAIYVPASLDQEERFDLQHTAGSSILRNRWNVFVEDRSWKKQQQPVLTSSNNYSNIDETPFLDG